MKLNLKRSELVELNMDLDETSKNDKEVFDKRFIYGVHRNLEYFKPEMESIRNTQKEPLRFQEFQNKIQQIGMESADKDEQGNPKLETKGSNQVFVITEKREEANRRLMELQNEYQDVIEEQKKNIEIFNQLMDESIEIDICPISFKYFPDRYNISKHNILKRIIKESDKELEAML